MSRVAEYFAMPPTTRSTVRETLAKHGMTPLGRPLPGFVPPEPKVDVRAARVEFQRGMYRVFQVMSSHLMVSHWCRTEAIRRAELGGLVVENA